jgi:hypothetical protein
VKETKKEWLDRILDLFHGLDDGRMEHITAAPSSMMAAAPAMVMAFVSSTGSSAVSPMRIVKGLVVLINVVATMPLNTGR